MATTKKTVPVSVVEVEDELVTKLGELFASNRVASLSAEVESLQTKLEAVSAKLAEETASTEQRREEMARTVKRLRQARLTEPAIEAAIKAQFGVSKRPAKRAEGETPRQSHKLDDGNTSRVMTALKANPNGVLMSELWDALPDMDRVGVQNLVRKMANKNQIKATGNTRSRRYVAA